MSQNRGKVSDCIECGMCENNCPQNQLIGERLKSVGQAFEKNQRSIFVIDAVKVCSARLDCRDCYEQILNKALKGVCRNRGYFSSVESGRYPSLKALRVYSRMKRYQHRQRIVIDFSHLLHGDMGANEKSVDMIWAWAYNGISILWKGYSHEKQAAGCTARFAVDHSCSCCERNAE